MATFLDLPLTIRLRIYDYLLDVDTIQVPNGIDDQVTSPTRQYEVTPHNKKAPHALQNTNRQLRAEIQSLPTQHLHFTTAQDNRHRPDLTPLTQWLKCTPLSERARIQSIQISTVPFRCGLHQHETTVSITLNINATCKITVSSERGACTSCKPLGNAWFQAKMEAELLKMFGWEMFFDMYEDRRVFTSRAVRVMGNQLRIYSAHDTSLR